MGEPPAERLPGHEVHTGWDRAPCLPPGPRSAAGLRGRGACWRGRDSNPQPSGLRSSAALWRRAAASRISDVTAAPLREGGRSAASCRGRAWPSWAPSPLSSSASSPPPSSPPSIRSRKVTSESTTGERPPRLPFPHPRAGPALTVAVRFSPQRRRVADLHQRAGFSPHAALHHVLQVSAGAVGLGWAACRPGLRGWG